MSTFPRGMTEECQERTSSIPSSVTKPPGRNLSLAVRVRRVVGRELIGTELDLNLFKRASKFEWHLRVVLVDDWRSVILTTARLRNSANLPMARSTLLSLIGALGFYHRRVFLPVVTRAYFSLLFFAIPEDAIPVAFGDSTEPHAEAILVQLSLRLRCRCRCRRRCRCRCRCRRRCRCRCRCRCRGRCRCRCRCRCRGRCRCRLVGHFR